MRYIVIVCSVLFLLAGTCSEDSTGPYQITTNIKDTTNQTIKTDSLSVDTNGFVVEMNGYLEASDVNFKLRGHIDCQSPDADCPMFVVLNIDMFFSRVDEPEKNGKIIVVRLIPENFDGMDVKDPLAEFPRFIVTKFPGIDKERIYITGSSAGSAGIIRGLCHVAKQSDKSKFGTTSEIYAAAAHNAGCSGCSEKFEFKYGKWHVISVNGEKDWAASGRCEDALRRMAEINGCQNLNAQWENVQPIDTFMVGADGTDKAQKIDFCPCEKGDVVGYVFKDEGHNSSFKKYYDPKIRSEDIFWEFFKDKKKPYKTKDW